MRVPRSLPLRLPREIEFLSAEESARPAVAQPSRHLSEPLELPLERELREFQSSQLQALQVPVQQVQQELLHPGERVLFLARQPELRAEAPLREPVRLQAQVPARCQGPDREPRRRSLLAPSFPIARAQPVRAVKKRERRQPRAQVRSSMNLQVESDA